MKLRCFTLNYDEESGEFDDQPLRQFCDENQVISSDQYFFSHMGRPGVAVMVQYRGLPSNVFRTRRTDSSARPEDGLEPAQRVRFDALRAWRSTRSKADGVPSYIVCTNRILAAVASIDPKSRSALGAIDGFGEAKLAAYGAEILSVLETVATSALPSTVDES